MQKKQKKAFSLIELSIVILIVSILITGSLGISKTAINNAKVSTTKERMDKVYKALTNFVLINRRLPCPAPPAIAKGTATYGIEATPAGGCTTTNPALTSTYTTSPVSAANLVYGMVPIQALGIEPDMAEDGFGTKFSYVVDKRFTEQSVGIADTNGFEILHAVKAEDGGVISPTLIEVQGPSGTALLPDLNGLFVLISHGANKFHGYNATGKVQNGVSTLNDEINNGYHSTTMDARFIAYSTEDPNFDDVVLFKTKTQLVRDAGLEFMMCNFNEAKMTSYAWTVNGSYGCIVCSSTADHRKTCNKYGVWGSDLATTCTANSVANCP